MENKYIIMIIDMEDKPHFKEKLLKQNRSEYDLIKSIEDKFTNIAQYYLLASPDGRYYEQNLIGEKCLSQWETSDGVNRQYFKMMWEYQNKNFDVTEYRLPNNIVQILKNIYYSSAAISENWNEYQDKLYDIADDIMERKYPFAESFDDINFYLWVKETIEPEQITYKVGYDTDIRAFKVFANCFRKLVEYMDSLDDNMKEMFERKVIDDLPFILDEEFEDFVTHIENWSNDIVMNWTE